MSELDKSDIDSQALPEIVGKVKKNLAYSVLVDLDHPNHYIAFLKSAIWGTLTYLAVAMLAIFASETVKLIYSKLVPQPSSFTISLVDSFGTIFTIISLASIAVIMVVETIGLVRKLTAERDKSGGESR